MWGMPFSGIVLNESEACWADVPSAVINAEGHPAFVNTCNERAVDALGLCAEHRKALVPEPNC